MSLLFLQHSHFIPIRRNVGRRREMQSKWRDVRGYSRYLQKELRWVVVVLLLFYWWKTDGICRDNRHQMSYFCMCFILLIFRLLSYIGLTLNCLRFSLQVSVCPTTRNPNRLPSSRKILIMERRFLSHQWWVLLLFCLACCLSCLVICKFFIWKDIKC